MLVDFYIVESIVAAFTCAHVFTDLFIVLLDIYPMGMLHAALAVCPVCTSGSTGE